VNKISHKTYLIIIFYLFIGDFERSRGSSHEDQDEDQEDEGGMRMKVKFTKNGFDLTTHYKIISGGQDGEIEHVSLSPSTTSSTISDNNENGDNQPSSSSHEHLMVDGNLDRLSEEIIDGIHNLLFDVGINHELFSYVDAKSLHKDDMLSLQWLKNLQKFSS